MKNNNIKITNSGNGSVIVNGSVNGGRKLQENTNQNLTKSDAIKELNLATSRTPPKEIALYLETLFGQWEEKPDHWLFMAQRYTPKTLRGVRSQMLKAHLRGDITILTPGAYFTHIVKQKIKRKAFRKNEHKES